MTKQKNNGKNSGFSLIELSMVVLILGLMIGGIVAVLTQESRRTKQVELKMKMDTIEKALGAFVKKNNRIPCPADGTYLVTNTYFGKEGGTVGAGNCGNGATYNGESRTADTTPPTANFLITYVAGGVVPVRTLGLADEYAFDPWGGRFTFAVDNRFTATDAFTTYQSNDTTGNITVGAEYGTTILTNAITVVISHGENSHGAFLLSGARKNAGSKNTFEQGNCNCSSTASASPYQGLFFIMANTTVNNADLLYSYDDITRYYTRNNFPTNSDTATEIK